MVWRTWFLRELMLGCGRTSVFLSCLLAFDLSVLFAVIAFTVSLLIKPSSFSKSQPKHACRIKYSFPFTPPATFLGIINGTCFILSCIIISCLHICLSSETVNTPWQELGCINLCAPPVPIGCT